MDLFKVFSGLALFVVGATVCFYINTLSPDREYPNKTPLFVIGLVAYLFGIVIIIVGIFQ